MNAFSDLETVDPPAKSVPADGMRGFRRNGFLTATGLLTREDCDRIVAHLNNGPTTAPADWFKGRAVVDRIIYDVAVRPELLSLVQRAIGPNIILWGADVPRRKPGQIHPWHTDIESSSADGGFVSLWIGLENTSRDSSLQVISGSHRFGQPIQKVLKRNRTAREEVSADAVLGWARERVPDAEFLQPDLQDGDALLFDGRLWHCSNNTRASGTRSALLLQYAAAGRPVRIPDLRQKQFPFRFFETPRPPVILVRGKSRSSVNRVVPPPPPLGHGHLPLLSTVIRQPALPLTKGMNRKWKPYHLFAGATRGLDRLTCHMSVLSPHHSPHPPHAHAEEELLIVLDGEATLVIADGPDFQNSRLEAVSAGQFVYYPAFQHHTIRNDTERPISYLMFKWRAAPRGQSASLGTKIVRPADPAADRAFSTQRQLQGTTRYLAKLHSHLSVVQQGAGYPPHADPYDVAIVVLSGAIETLGEAVEQPGVIFYAAGEPHGMKAVSAGPARYLVFEFHANGILRTGEGSVAAHSGRSSGPVDGGPPPGSSGTGGKSGSLFLPMLKRPWRVLKRIGAGTKGRIS